MRKHSWHAWGYGGDDRCILCGEMRSRASEQCGDPGREEPTMNPTPERAEHIEHLRTQERELRARGVEIVR